MEIEGEPARLGDLSFIHDLVTTSLCNEPSQHINKLLTPT